MSHFTKLFSRAQTVIPGGVNSPVRAFKSVGGTPIFFKKGIGPYLVDLNDQQYIDYVNSWGALILGHAPSSVVESIQQAISRGLGFGTPTEIEVEMAELITRLIPSIEQIRMVNSGTEATQSAIRLARGFTKRHKILKFEGCYHGHTDALLMKGGSGLLTFATPESPGIPEDYARHTLVAPFNDLAAVKALFSQWGEEIAAVIVEPVAANMNCILPVPGFLAGLRALCDQYQTLLIFDEVITGFRVGLGGAQALYHIQPDLTCLGKIIGGGLPVGAFGGKRAIMQYLAPEGPIYQAGTLSGNPIALTAGFTTLQALQAPQFYERLENMTHCFLTELHSLAKQHSIALHLQSIGSIFGIFFTEQKLITNYTEVAQCQLEQFKKFFHAMLKQGIYLAPSAFEVGFISSAHNPDTLSYTLEAADSAFQHLNS